MRMLTNMQALRTTNTMERIQNANAKTMAKLSSGLAINRATDNASGLAISEKMRAQIRGLDRADRNIQDAKSLMNTADSGLDTITSMMQRMRELAISSLNDTHTERDRKLIQEEFQQLQYAIDDATNHSQWSGMPVIDNHSPAFNKIEGNHVFPKTTAVKIISGLNDDLEVVIDGVSRTLTLPEGDYEPVDVLIDVLDDLLMDIDPNLIAHVTENRTISIQAEDSQSIDYIKGGASFLLYEYTMGNPPGMIISTTEYEDGGSIEVVAGKSDTLSFYIGTDKMFHHQFTPDDYTKEQIIDSINKELDKMGEKDVRAVMFGDKRIGIKSNKYVITGVGGNMIEIDNITSILYDNRKSGSITKRQAEVSGYKNIKSGVNFTQENQKLIFFVEGKKVEVAFPTEGKLDGGQIVNHINTAMKAANVKGKASLDNSGRLSIESAYYGSKSSVIIDDKASTAFKDLFVSHNVTYQTVEPKQGQNASLEGYYTIENITEITAANNKLNIQVGNTTHSIELPKKEYSKDELIKALNEATKELPIQFSSSPSSVNGKYGLNIRNVDTNESFSLDSNSPLYDTLMRGTRIIEDSPSISQGTTTREDSVEGIAGVPKFIYTPATATGKSAIKDLQITDENNQMTFIKNGEQIEIELQEGTYKTVDDFIKIHQNRFNDKGIILSSGSNNTLQLTTKEEGENQSFSNFGGSSHDLIMGRREERVESPWNTIGTSTNSTIAGVYKVPRKYEIDQSNSELTFDYVHDGQSYEVKVKLASDTYENPSDIAEALEVKIREALQAAGLQDAEIKVTTDSFGYLNISTKNAGSSYSIKNFNGNFFKELFTRRESTYSPNPSGSGYTRENDTYIVGREVIRNQEFIVHPEINDLLQFDFKKNGVSETIQIKLAPGKYTNHSELISQINTELEKELDKKGFFPDLIRAQVGGVSSGTNQSDDDKLVFKVNSGKDGRNDSGQYVIDSVRGTAAYTFFYPSQGEPEPSHTIGVTNLSSGAEIIEGENDTFIFDVDNKEKVIKLPPGNYNAEDLLKELNDELVTADAGVIASYFEGKLKLSTSETGQIPIDGIRGNARGTLFYETDTRKEDRDWTFQTGANTGDNVQMDKVRTSAKLLRINTIMLDDPARAEKALDRLDAALKTISQERGKVGAYTNRLDHAMNSVRVTGESLSASESLIRDTNIAKELLEKVKNDLLQSASQQMLAHANNNPQKILELLR